MVAINLTTVSAIISTLKTFKVVLANLQGLKENSTTIDYKKQIANNEHLLERNELNSKP